MTSRAGTFATRNGGPIPHLYRRAPTDIDVVFDYLEAARRWGVCREHEAG